MFSYLFNAAATETSARKAPGGDPYASGVTRVKDIQLVSSGCSASSRSATNPSVSRTAMWGNLFSSKRSASTQKLQEAGNDSAPTLTYSRSTGLLTPVLGAAPSPLDSASALDLSAESAKRFPPEVFSVRPRLYSECVCKGGASLRRFQQRYTPTAQQRTIHHCPPTPPPPPCAQSATLPPRATVRRSPCGASRTW